MATQVSEKQAREVAEAAREQEWKLPSFGKQLFMGDFRLDLISPQPRQSPEAVEKGERFLRELRAFLVEEVDPLRIERDAKIPEETIDGLKKLGALGHEGPRGVRRARALAGLLQPRAGAGRAPGTRRCPRCSAPTSRSASPSR